MTDAPTSKTGRMAAFLYCTTLITAKMKIAGRKTCTKLGLDKEDKKTSNDNAANFHAPRRKPVFFPMPSIIAAYQMKQGNATALTMRLVGLCSKFGLLCPIIKLGLKNGSQIGDTTTRKKHAARTRSSLGEYFFEK